ncbi:MAG TPA: hypothetical protein DGG94_01005 [Micromonosporaceae bacterium]|nr:hypothetical protein [Micromonosporaceae bacterium]
MACEVICDVLTGLLAGIAAVAVSAALPAPESSDVVCMLFPCGPRMLTGQIAHLARTVAR